MILFSEQSEDWHFKQRESVFNALVPMFFFNILFYTVNIASIHF